MARVMLPKSRGDFADIPTDVAALFMDAQHGGAMRMQREGVPNDTVVSVLGTALHILALDQNQNVITH